jgi:hypothetical protein
MSGGLIMPRPERPLDPSAGPLQQFAADLRKLRTEAGNPPYRDMAAAAHVSKASLSAAAAGHRLPTWEVVRAYVTACGADIGEWREKWLATREELALPPVPEPTSTETAPAPARRRLLLVAAAAVALVVVALVAGAVWSGDEPTGPVAEPSPSTSQARYVGGSEPLADNADPKKTGCGDDPAKVTTLDTVEVNTLNNNLLGVAQIRHAAGCRASWGRFEPSDRMTYLPGPFTVTITAHRPATGTVGTPFTAEFDGQPVFGNILLVDDGCVGITVDVRSPHGNGTATTACRR